MSDRPEFRTLYATFADDADVHALSAPAFKALIMLKLSLPVIGLGVIYPSKLCDQVGCDRATLEVILGELEAPKPGRDRGWIVRDRNIVWVVNAFACEPGMTPANRNHMKFVRKLVAGVDSRSNVVAAFREFYRQWFQGDTKPIRKPSPPASNGMHRPSESHGDPSGHTSGHDSTLLNTTKSGDLDQERDPSPAASPPLPPAAAPPFASLRDLTAAAPAVARFVHRFYPPETTPAERLTDIERQLVGVLGAGTSFNGGLLRTTIARLEVKCAEVSTERIRDRDKAIVVLLTKLNDSTDVTTAAVVAEQQQRATESRDTSQELVEAERWLAQQPFVAQRIEQQIAADYPGPVNVGSLREIARRSAREGLVLRSYRARASPDPAMAESP